MKVLAAIKYYKHTPSLAVVYFPLLMLLLPQLVNAQFGGFFNYKFISLPNSARVSALGGNLITVMDDDINLAYANPSLLNPQMHQQIGFSHSFHMADINHGYVAMGLHNEKLATTFYGGIHYMGYGELQLTNEFFQNLGTFKANEVALTVGAGRMVDERVSLGANVKFINSRLEAYSSSALAADIAATYSDTASNFTAALVIKNAGFVLSSYTDLENSSEELPFEIQLGISKKLRYLPFRFSIIMTNLQRWDLRYDDPNQVDDPGFFGEGDTNNDSPFIDNLFRHFVFNGEFLIGKRENFRMRVGYNNFLRQDLNVDEFASLAGFSFGFGIKVNRFRLDYGRMTYHIAGGTNHLSVSTNLQEFK
ncbi:MAG: type IX secretion system protein PorQ [Bacteroidota bacterium]